MFLKRFFALFEKGDGSEKSVLAEALWTVSCAMAGTDPSAQESLMGFLKFHGLFEPDGTTHPKNVVDWALQEVDPRNLGFRDIEQPDHKQSNPYPCGCFCDAQFVTTLPAEDSPESWQGI